MALGGAGEGKERIYSLEKAQGQVRGINCVEGSVFYNEVPCYAITELRGQKCQAEPAAGGQAVQYRRVPLHRRALASWVGWVGAVRDGAMDPFEVRLVWVEGVCGSWGESTMYEVLRIWLRNVFPAAARVWPYTRGGRVRVLEVW